MAEILLKRDSRTAATYVPNTFIDDYMTHADGEFVKIYLYLLRCMNSSLETTCSISDIADKFDHTEKDVTRALKYWEKMQLLCLKFNKEEELTSICLSEPASVRVTPDAAAQTALYTVSVPADPFTDPDACGTAQSAYPCVYDGTVPADTDAYAGTAKQAAPGQAEEASPVPQRADYTKQQLAQFQEDETVQEVLFVAERYLARPLKHTEMQVILYWMDRLELSQDMIDYLIEQCVAKNHKDIWYMNKIAVSWAEQKIRTLTAAKQESAGHSQTARRIKKAFGIYGRDLLGEELQYYEKWTDEMELPAELIELACKRTIDSIHKVSFKYAHSILEGWHKQNARTLNDVKLLDAQYLEAKRRQMIAGKTAAVAHTANGTTRNGFANFKQRTYNYEKLERELLSNVR